MATVTANLEDMFTRYGGPTEGDAASFVPLVFAEITEENVLEVLRFVASIPTLTIAFWRRVNDAPSTDEDWRSYVYICSGGEDMRRRMKDQERRAIEIVRATLPGVQLRRQALFRR